MEFRFSRYGAASTRPSPVNRMMAAFASDFRDSIDINLGVGYVNERTIPVDRIRDALDAVIADPSRYRQAFNYGGPSGSANLTDSIRRFLLESGHGGLDEATLSAYRLIVGPCGATSLLDGLAELFEPGIVVTADPMYYIYANELERKGFEILAVPEDAEGIRTDLVEEKLARLGDRAAEIAFFYTVTVNNPSCTILSNRRRRALVEVAASLSRRQDRRIPVFFDGAYELLLHDPAAERFQSALPFDDLGIAYEIGTLSKVLAPALRIGYLLGPPGDLMDAMVQKTSDAGFSAALFSQEMASWMLDNAIHSQLARVNAGYRENALAVRRAIDDTIGEHLAECGGGSAGFYYYLTFERLETHTRSPFFRYLTRSTGDPAIDGPAANPHPRVLYIPGEYCVHARGDLVEAGKRQLRLSYGFEPAERVAQALEWMRRAIQETPVAVVKE